MEIRGEHVHKVALLSLPSLTHISLPYHSLIHSSSLYHLSWIIIIWYYLYLSHQEFRDFCGPYDPTIAKIIAPKSLRALYGKTKVLDAVHCTDLEDDCTLEVCSLVTHPEPPFSLDLSLCFLCLCHSSLFHSVNTSSRYYSNQNE